MIDNYDSFTYIIVQYFEQLGQHVKVITNDECTIDDLIKYEESLTTSQSINAIVIGPGPGRPEEAGMTLDIINKFAGRLPIFGICLGHQAIAMAYGADVVQAQNIMHGRVSTIYHHNQGVFVDLPCPVDMTRYHSLVIDKTTLPNVFEVTAWTNTLQTADEVSQTAVTTDKYVSTDRWVNTDDVTIDDIMGIRHRYLNLEGVQFHPESILSEAGFHLLNNFLLQHNLATFSTADIINGKHRQQPYVSTVNDAAHE